MSSEEVILEPSFEERLSEADGSSSSGRSNKASGIINMNPHLLHQASSGIIRHHEAHSVSLLCFSLAPGMLEVPGLRLGSIARKDDTIILSRPLHESEEVHTQHQSTNPLSVLCLSLYYILSIDLLPLSAATGSTIIAGRRAGSPS